MIRSEKEPKYRIQLIEQFTYHSMLARVYEVRGLEVKIIESRLSSVNSHECADSPIARLKYDPEILGWERYWSRSSGRWMKYPGLEPRNHLQSLVYEIVQDPHRVFWG